MQRLTKYGLLLKAILKHTDDEDELRSLSVMVSNINFKLYALLLITYIAIIYYFTFNFSFRLNALMILLTKSITA